MLPSCAFWFQAGHGETLSGSNVVSVVDRSRNAHVLTWTVQPTIVASDAGYNGQTTWDLGDGDGTTEAYGTTDNITLPQPAIVLWCGGTASSVRSKVICGSSGSGPYLINPTSAIGTQIYSGVALGYNGYSGFNSATKRIEGGIFNGVSSRYILNSTIAVTTGDAGTGSLTVQPMQFAALFPGNYRMGGKAGVFCGFSSVDSVLLARVMAYMATTYSITLT